MTTTMKKSLSLVHDAAHELDGSDSNYQAESDCDRRPTDRDLIFELQVEQRIHDDQYHPEISRLSMHHRLNHLALHFAKYAGRIANACLKEDYTDVDRTLTDIFIIALSSANVLNFRLSEQIRETQESEEYQGEPGTFDPIRLLLSITNASGKMAGACEAIDHLEARPLREEISAAVGILASSAQTCAAQRNLNITAAIRNRLEQVRSSKIFHGHM